MFKLTKRPKKICSDILEVPRYVYPCYMITQTYKPDIYDIVNIEKYDLLINHTTKHQIYLVYTFYFETETGMKKIHHVVSDKNIFNMSCNTLPITINLVDKTVSIKKFKYMLVSFDLDIYTYYLKKIKISLFDKLYIFIKNFSI